MLLDWVNPSLRLEADDLCYYLLRHRPSRKCKYKSNYVFANGVSVNLTLSPACVLPSILTIDQSSLSSFSMVLDFGQFNATIEAK